jgi:hypothetical protein
MIILRALFTIFVVFLVNGVYLSQFDLSIFEPQLTVRIHPPDAFDYSGVLNIHSQKSSGSGGIEDIIESAQKTGLDFVFITDTQDLQPDKSKEQYYDQVLVFIDSEWSFLDMNALIYGKTDYSDFTSPGQVQALISDRLSEPPLFENNKGMLILAHPFKKGTKWSGEWPLGFNGIEIINLKGIWQNMWFKNKPSFLWSVLTYPFNPELSLVRMFPFPKKEMELWDSLNKQQKTFGFAGADADAKLKFPKDLEVPSYETFFNIVRTHVLLSSELTGNYSEDSKKIKKALLNGQFYLSLDLLARPNGFNIYISPSNLKDPYPMGSSIEWKNGLQLNIELVNEPLYPIDVIIYKNGTKVLASDSINTPYKLDGPGTYRVVVRILPTLPLPDGKKWVPWIITNPFYVN